MLVIFMVVVLVVWLALQLVVVPYLVSACDKSSGSAIRKGGCGGDAGKLKFKVFPS